MLNNEPLPIAIDLEVTIDVGELESKLATDGDTLVILCTDGRSANVIVSDRFADMPHVADHIHFLTDVNGTELIHDFWIRLNITAKEFYEKLVIENEPNSGTSPTLNEVKVYVNVLLMDDLAISIQTAHNTVYEGGPAR